MDALGQRQVTAFAVVSGGVIGRSHRVHDTGVASSHLLGPAPSLGDVTDVIEELTRWEDAGGTWRVLGRSGDDLTVGLFTCDGGDEMSRLVAPAAMLEPFLAGRTASSD